jgi:hypothetical protein
VRPPRLALFAITVVAAALRFSTLDLQSFWLDEAYTLHHVRLPFGDMLREVRNDESTPPLYFALAWLWAKVFGTGEIGLRSLSALLGTATVPLAYAAGARLVSARVGILMAALAATNPLLVWYSQEARAYALLALLCAASFALFAQALDSPRPRTLALWAVASALALITHYFAVFVVAVEATWLLAARGTRRVVLAAVAGAAVLGIAALPVALAQARDLHDRWAAGDPGAVPAHTVADIGKKFLIGESGLGPFGHHARVAFLLVLVGLVLLVLRAERHERRGAAIALAVGGIAAALPAVLAVAGFDVLNTRNLIEAWVPLTVVYATGYGARRAGVVGLLAAGVLVALFTATTIHVFADERTQREDWRGLARVLGPPSLQRLVVVSPSLEQPPLEAYARWLRPVPPAGDAVEVDVVQLADAPSARAPAGTVSAHVEHVQRLRLTRFRLRGRRPVTKTQLERVVRGNSVAVLRG